MSKEEQRKLNQLTHSYTDPPWLVAARQKQNGQQMTQSRERGRERTL